MTVARSQLVDVDVTPWYHVISKTVRGAFLLAEGEGDRKQWIEDRLEQLSQIFAIEVAGFAVLDNHLHILVRLCPERVETWSDEEVVQRWSHVVPRRGKDRQPLAVTPAWVQQKAAEATFVQELRERLANLGWFMKCLKEPLARRANREEGCQGAFWQGRYKSIAVLDEEALLATCAYIDLNPVAAGMAETPEESLHTSVRSRVQCWRQEGGGAGGRGSGKGRVAGAASRAGGGHWLCPLGPQGESGRSCLMEGLTLESYLQLVDWTSRLMREGKARMSQQAPSILERLGTGVGVWRATMEKLFTRPREVGVAFAFHRGRLAESAERRGCHHLANLNGCPA